jgi:hypothetical protein
VKMSHGCASGQIEPLQQLGIAKLLFDLLTKLKAANRASVFDMPLLADHHSQAAAWGGTITAGGGASFGLNQCNVAAQGLDVSVIWRSLPRATCPQSRARSL